MASKKKKLKKLTKQLIKSQDNAKKYKRQIERLCRQLDKRETRILELQNQLQQHNQSEYELVEALPPQLDPVCDEVSRDVLRKATFLRDRYEFHLAQNKTKPVARQEANNDLVAQYGIDSGFTEQELQDVLS